MEKYAKLKPAFRSAENKGTITAANATGLTDGGSAVLMTSEEYAKKKGWPTDIQVKAWHNSVCVTSHAPFVCTLYCGTVIVNTLLLSRMVV